jgi:hypothetical protein
MGLLPQQQQVCRTWSVTPRFSSSIRHMRTPSAVVVSLPLLLAACVGTIHKSPSEVSTVEVAVYKAGLQAGCKDAGMAKGDSEQAVTAFCSCVARAFESRLSAVEWQQATYFAQQRRDREERAVLAPHLPALKACRP